MGAGLPQQQKHGVPEGTPCCSAVKATTHGGPPGKGKTRWLEKLNLGVDGDLVPSSGRTVIRLALPQAVILRGESSHGCAVVDSHIPGKLALNVHRCLVRSSRVIDELAVVQGDVDNAIVTFSVNINEFAVFRRYSR